MVGYCPYWKSDFFPQRGQPFLKSLEKSSEIARVNTIYWCGYVCKINGFWLMQHWVVADLYKCVLLTLEEEKRFLKITEDKKFSSEMEILKNNTLRSTITNKVLIENQGNNLTVCIFNREVRKTFLFACWWPWESMALWFFWNWDRMKWQLRSKSCFWQTRLIRE